MESALVPITGPEIIESEVAARPPNEPAQGSSILDMPPDVFQAGLDRRRQNHKALIAWVAQALVEGTDFGKIHVVKKETCDKGKYCKNENHFSKPVLFKPGSEKICGMLGVIPSFPTLKDYESAAVSGVNVETIILRCELREASGRILAEGAGARSVSKDYGDINKSLKMAEKSGQIDATLRLAGLSEVFTQDLEDMVALPEKSSQNGPEKPLALSGPEVVKRPEDQPAVYPGGALMHPDAVERLKCGCFMSPSGRVWDRVCAEHRRDPKKELMDYSTPEAQAMRKQGKGRVDFVDGTKAIRPEPEVYQHPGVPGLSTAVELASYERVDVLVKLPRPAVFHGDVPKGFYNPPGTEPDLERQLTESLKEVQNKDPEVVADIQAEGTPDFCYCGSPIGLYFSTQAKDKGRPLFQCKAAREKRDDLLNQGRTVRVANAEVSKCYRAWAGKWPIAEVEPGA